MLHKYFDHATFRGEKISTDIGYCYFRVRGQ